MSLLQKFLNDDAPSQPSREPATTPDALAFIRTWVCEHGVEWHTWTTGGRPDADDPICGCWLDLHQPGLLPDRIRIDGVRLRYSFDHFPEDYENVQPTLDAH